MSLGKIVRKITRYKVQRLIYAFWYLPTYITYAKILAYIHDHVQQFYGNCRTLNKQLQPIKQGEVV